MNKTLEIVIWSFLLSKTLPYLTFLLGISFGVGIESFLLGMIMSYGCLAVAVFGFLSAIMPDMIDEEDFFDIAREIYRFLMVL